MGEHGILNALYDAGITYNDVNPDYVVVGEASGYNLEMITKASPGKRRCQAHRHQL